MSERLKIINTIFTAILVVSAVVTVCFALQSLGDMKDIAEISENISNINIEIIDWYKNPKPVFTTWNSLHGRTLHVSNYNSYYFRSYNYTYEQIYSELTIWVYNSGRKPAINTKLSIDFELANYGLDLPYPFKIYSITTPSYFVGYDEIENATVFGDDYILVLSNGTKVDFLPAIDVIDNTTDILLPTDIPIENIGPGETVSFSMNVFATRNNMSGKMVIRIYCDDLETEIAIPIETI